MTVFARYGRPPVAVVATSQEWSSLTLASVLSARGYSLMRLFEGAEVLRRLADRPADVLIIHDDLWDYSGEDLCRELAQRRLAPPNMPIIIVSRSPWHTENRTNALRAGAWEVLALPLDADQFMLRLDTWVCAKLYADRANDRHLLDVDGQLYNTQGLVRRLREATAGAVRYDRPLSCIVLHPQLRDERPAVASVDLSAVANPETGWKWRSPVPAELSQRLGEKLCQEARTADAVGRLNDGDFIIIAPETDVERGFGLAMRLKEALEDALNSEGHHVRVRAACCGVPRISRQVDPADVLTRTMIALRTGLDEEDGAVRIVALD